MKKLLGLGFILAALAVVTMGMVGFPKIDVNIWPDRKSTRLNSSH